MGLFSSFVGPSRRETVWKEVAREIGGHYTDGGFWNQNKLTFQFQTWTMTLDTYTVKSKNSSTTYTRLRAPYVNADGFRFTIYRKSIFSGIGKWLGMQDITIGTEPFDEEFIIKGNDESRVRDFFADEQIREFIHMQPRIHFEVKDDEGWFGASFPGGVDELYFTTVGVITDERVLKDLFMLFGASLHRLCEMGSAYDDDPGQIH
jgi:hypothetical protein